MKTILYSLDNGETWTEYDVESWMDELDARFYLVMELELESVEEILVKEIE